MRKLILCVLAWMCHTAMWAQMIIPAPKEMKVERDGRVKVTAVQERIDPRMKLPNEGYTLRVRGAKALIRAKDERGLVWARQTLRQLKDEDGLCPEVTIRDWPEFPIRGFMHDTGRNFRPVDLLLKDIDLFSFYKLNTFHWHLTDHPGWRIECKAYPQLNKPENMRKGRKEGMFYSYDDIRHVIRYAKERGVMVIPEIDMPGHSDYFKNTFGFGMATKEGMVVLEACLKEFLDEIPREDCPYIHIGSDEVNVDNPQEFITFCENIITRNGRTPMVWDPGLPASENTIAQVWSGQIGTKIEKEGGYGKRFVDSYNGYLNNGNVIWNTYRQLLHTFCGKGVADSNAMGSILCLWNDLRIDDQTLLMPHNGCPAAVAAFAEGIWRGGKKMPQNNTSLMPEAGSPMHEYVIDWERRFAYHCQHYLEGWDIRWRPNAHMEWRVTIPERRGSDPAKMKWVPAWGAAINLQEIAYKNGVKLSKTMDAWAETRLYAERDTVIKAIVGFETCGRSNRIGNGIGEQGLWEADGRLFVGESEIFPPKPWKEPGKYQFMRDAWKFPDSEIPYTEEQLFWMREPAQIPLKAGWNNIRLYCPRLFNQRDWTVTFMPL